MSHKLIDHSADLKRLRDEGYHLEEKGGYLLVRGVPYVDAHKAIKYGVLIAKLDLVNDKTIPPESHVAQWAGEYPCDALGAPIERIRHSDISLAIGDVTATLSFSAKPKPRDKYENYHSKMSTYAQIISGPANVIDPDATAKSFPTVRAGDDDSVFKYVDTAASRADIGEANNKLALARIAIVGLGGTGSYVLDLVAKTPVKEIHLFDGDVFLQHNAFRSPGAASGEELDERLQKVAYYDRIYSKMRRGIVAHPHRVTAENASALEGMQFVFLCMEGAGKKDVVDKLEALGIPFVDVGMGIYLKNGTLNGSLRTTTSTAACRARARTRITFAESAEKNEYDANIQIADLNALNATLAVIKWKKLFGFYMDQEQEHFSLFTIGGNDLTNEDLG